MARRTETVRTVRAFWSQHTPCQFFAALSLVALSSLFAWILVAQDGRLHWDEPAYLYAAEYLDVATILNGHFQPSGIDSFTTSRLFHLLTEKAAFGLASSDKSYIGVVQYIYIVMLLFALVFIFLTLDSLLPRQDDVIVAMVLLALSPIVLWLAFKTMPETPALLLGSIACFALLRAALAGRAATAWIVLAGLAAAATALFKNILLIMPVTMVVALMLVGGLHYSRPRLAATAALAAGCSAGFFAVICMVLGISLDEYLGGVASWAMTGKVAPLAARIFFLTLEGGMLAVALLLAPFAKEKTAVAFFLLWYGLATLAVANMAPNIEERYLLPNIAALAGLTALAVAVVRAFASRFGRLAPLIIPAAVVLVGGSSVFAQQFMSHEVAMSEIDAMIAALDRRFGRGGYTILSPWEYSTFLYLRVRDPDLPVISVFEPPERIATTWSASRQRHFFGRRFAAGPAELDLSRGPFVYVGFRAALPAQNLLTAIAHLPGDGLREIVAKQVAKNSNETQLSSSWAWKLVGSHAPDLKVGHYEAYVLDRSVFDSCSSEPKIAGSGDAPRCAGIECVKPVAAGGCRTLQ